jgi:hypothetical protein
MMKVVQALIAVALLVMVPATFTRAQGPPPPPPLNEVPLDGFSALLLAAGAGYGARRLKKRSNRDR